MSKMLDVFDTSDEAVVSFDILYIFDQEYKYQGINLQSFICMMTRVCILESHIFTDSIDSG